MRMPTKLQAILLLALGSGCLLASGWVTPPNDESSTKRGLLGPVSSLIASLKWVQFEQDVHTGTWEEAYLHAQSALAWDPGSVEGWSTLASHLIFLRASKQNETNDNKRVEWMRRGLDVLAEGESVCDRPGDLALIAGQTLTLWIAPLTEQEAPGLPWPGGGFSAWNEGIQCLMRAQAAGHSRAAFVLDLAIQEVGVRYGWQLETD